MNENVVVQEKSCGVSASGYDDDGFEPPPIPAVGNPFVRCWHKKSMVSPIFARQRGGKVK